MVARRFIGSILFSVFLITSLLIIFFTANLDDEDIAVVKETLLGGSNGSNEPSGNQASVSQPELKGTDPSGSTTSVNSAISPNSNTIDQQGSYQRENAVFFSLVRNTELRGMLASIKSVENRFNRDYHYDWYFANNEAFTEEFKEKITNAVSGEVKFILIPEEYWSVPESIDSVKFRESLAKAQADRIMYGGMESYRHMCRFNSGFFYKLKEFEKIDYYWRIEPKISFSCDINYDVFKMMREKGKMYGFNMCMVEDRRTIPTLWKKVREFMQKYPHFISSDNNMKFILDENNPKEYSTRHFWSNFEVGDLNFYRSEAYEAFFNYLDSTGGFFYERWGDAPVHTIGVSLLLPLEKIAFIGNTGYYHKPNQDCPVVDTLRESLNCNCDPSKDFTWHKWSCVAKFFELNGLEMPEGSEKHS